MAPSALALALAAAVLHACWNVFLRASEDVEARTAVVLGLSVLFFAPVAVATWSVSWAAVPYVAASAALETVYFALLVVAYRRRELSVVYPIARGSAPLLVLLGTAVVLGREVSTGAAVGVCLVAVGVVLVRGIRPEPKERSSRWRSAARSPATRSSTKMGCSTPPRCPTSSSSCSRSRSSRCRSPRPAGELSRFARS